MKIPVSSFALALLFPFIAPLAKGAVLAGWDFSGLSTYGASPLTATTSIGNVTVGGLTRGSGVGTSGTAASNAWGGNDFEEGTSLSSAISAGNLATFSLTANSGYSLSISGIDAYNVRRSSSGPTTGQWQYQVGANEFVTIGTPITWGSSTSSSGNLQASIDLSGISALQNVAAGTTITFRVVSWTASGEAGTWYLNNFQSGNDFVINGTVIPEPSLTLLGGLGLIGLLRRRRAA